MFIKMFLTPQQLNALHEVVNGPEIRAEVAKILCVRPDTKAVDSFKERMISIETSDFSKKEGTYKVDLKLEDRVYTDNVHVYTPISVITIVMTAIGRFPSTSQAIKGEQGRHGFTDASTQIETGSKVHTWTQDTSKSGLYDWSSGPNSYHVARVDGDQVYLVEVEHKKAPDWMLDGLANGRDVAFAKERFEYRRTQALKELERRGTDHFTRQEFILEV